jgi:hypothetical protein
MLAAGALAGRVAAADRELPKTRSISAGAATLTLPDGWRTTEAPAPPGTVAARTTGNGEPALALIAFGRPGDASLVPPALRHAVRGLRRDSSRARLAGYRAWSYTGRSSSRAVRVSVLPSSRGVLGVACLAASPRSADQCAAVVRSVSIARGRILDPTPETALRLRAPEVLATLDSVRVHAHLELRDTRTAAMQTAWAREIARAHETALASLRPFVGSRRMPLTDALAEAAGAYAALAHAAGKSSPARFNAARANAIEADGAVASAVSGLAAAGPPAAQRVAPVPELPTTGVPVLTILVVLTIALLVVLLPPGIRRALGARDRVLLDLDAGYEPCILAPARRRPIAPPPTFGRWNETPKARPDDM